MEDQCKQHAAHEQALKNDKEQLNMHSREINAITLCLERLTVLSEQTKEDTANQEKRIAALEAQPAERWQTVTRYLLLVITGAIVGTVAGYLGMH